MKIRNKITGETLFISVDLLSKYKSLEEFNEEWEDYEEPKDKNYWYIDDLGRINFSSEVLDEIEGKPNNWVIRKLINNYFETEEEAEKALEKLKAWKWLKDRGFRFKGINENNGSIKTAISSKNVTFSEFEKFYDVMNLLFGGEE